MQVSIDELDVQCRSYVSEIADGERRGAPIQAGDADKCYPAQQACPRTARLSAYGPEPVKDSAESR
jgi:hypothetical protein